MAGQPDLPGNSNSRWTRLRQEQCPVAHDSIEVHRSWFQTKCLEFWDDVGGKEKWSLQYKSSNSKYQHKNLILNPSPPNHQIPAEKGCWGKFSGVQIPPRVSGLVHNVISTSRNPDRMPYLGLATLYIPI